MGHALQHFALCKLGVIHAVLVGALAALAGPIDARQPRSHGARVAFVQSHPCPSTHQAKLPCPGYVIDHVVALACGGRDRSENMQWQTVAAAKEKDRWERAGCPR